MIYYIKELLKTHDCVVIPGLGGLIGHYEPARRNIASGTMAPPMKRIAFNSVLRQNDGLLIQYVTSCENINYEAAKLKVESFKDEVNQALQLNGSFLFPGIGKLSRDESNHLHFYPILKENLLLDTYSLPLVVAQPIRRIQESFATAESELVHDNNGIKATAETADIIEIQSSDDRVIIYQPWIFRAAAVIGMAFLLTTVGMSFVRGDINGEQLSILPDTRTVPEAMMAASDFTVDLPEANFHLYELMVTEIDVEEIGELKEKEEVKTKTVVIETPVNSPATIDHRDKFYVIVGSFLDQQRLNREIATMKAKGYTVETIPGPNGYTRVGLTFDGSRDSRRGTLNEIRRLIHPDAWLINS